MRLTVVRSNGTSRAAVVAGDSFAFVPSLVASDLTVVLTDAELLARVAAEAQDIGSDGWRPLEDATFALPIARPGKVVCLGLNYADHAKEGGHQIPDYPSIFLRCTTSLLPAGEPIVRPGVSERLDYEAELMVVIGRRCHRVSEDEALAFVFGYTCFNDASLRDYQRKTSQWAPGKNFDRTGAVGPIVVTADELPDGADGLAISCRLNGQRVQGANTRSMMVSVAKAISLISEFATLEPGDLVAMGTPEGVGAARNPPLWMKHGDLVEVEIESIGVLRNRIADEVDAVPA
jgi:2-keto-4-pentenoate hydratase/2-oxohepta-3-ene-1,7-dioic acid hydratase in catechol pathway